MICFRDILLELSVQCSAFSLQMEFFNKYKDLFGVPQGLGVPSSRLRLDNELFIEKTYIPTKTQQYSLNGKLRELKKDYNDFEYTMDQLSRMRLTPKRGLSRRGKEQMGRSSAYIQKSNQNTDIRSPKTNILSKQVQPPPIIKYDYQQKKQQLLNDEVKRQSWLKYEQNNILKHSQLDHIFSNKLNNVYDLDEIKPSTLQKSDPQLVQSMDSRKPKQNFTIKQRSKQRIETKPSNERASVGGGNALSRRQKAKNNLQFRRKKLQQLLRTLW